MALRDGVAIGAANAVIFDFAPQVDIGAEILSPRGQDQRLAAERPAAQRRREKDRAYHTFEEQDEASGEAPSTSSGRNEQDPGHDDA